MSEEICVLTKEQARRMLPDGETIHTFYSTSLALIGADWSKGDILASIDDHDCEIGGLECQRFNHGLVIHTQPGPLFVECKKGFDYKAMENEVLSTQRPVEGNSTGDGGKT